MERILDRYEKQSLLQRHPSLSCVPWHTLTGLAFATLFLMLVALIQPFGPTIYPYIFGLVNVCYPLLFAVICLKDVPATLRSFHTLPASKRPGRRFSPLLLGGNMLVLVLAESSFLLYFLLNNEQEAPFPSLPYMLVTGIYPCLIGAVLLLPKYGISPVARLRILLDSLIIIVAVATFCFYFLLAPLLMLSDESAVEKIAGTLFPSADLIVIFCLLLVALRSDEPQLRPVLIMLGLALAAIFLLHVGRLVDILSDTLHWVTRLACAWIPASALVTGVPIA